MPETPTPNKYSQIAQRHWQTTSPSACQELPTGFFEELGAQIQSQVSHLSDQLAGPDPPGEQYLQKVGRLNMARLQAEEVVLSQMVWTSLPLPEEEEDMISYPQLDLAHELMYMSKEPDPEDETDP